MNGSCASCRHNGKGWVCTKNPGTAASEDYVCADYDRRTWVTRGFRIRLVRKIRHTGDETRDGAR